MHNEVLTGISSFGGKGVKNVRLWIIIQW